MEALFEIKPIFNLGKAFFFFGGQMLSTNLRHDLGR